MITTSITYFCVVYKEYQELLQTSPDVDSKDKDSSEDIQETINQTTFLL
jgi:hypothetical protein